MALSSIAHRAVTAFRHANSDTMSDVVPAVGAVLSDVLRARHQHLPNGLSAHANIQFHTARRKTAWGSLFQQTYAFVDGSTTLASAECYALKGVVDERPVPVRGIGSVCCDPSSAAVDAARTLISTLVDASDAPVVLLFPSAAIDNVILDGFANMPTIETTLRVIEATRYGAPMTPVRGGEDRDLQAIVAMGRTRALPFRFHLDRDDDFVRYAITSRRLLCGLAPARSRELQFFIAEEGVTAAAYVVISVTEGHWMIEECGDRDPTGARVGALLQALIAREPQGTRPVIRSVWPPAFLPPQVAVVSTAETRPSVRIAIRDASRSPLAAGDVLYWQGDVF